jgi:hypothetical protein
MSVQDFVQRIMDLNSLIDYTLLPDSINSPGVQTLKFTDADLAQIVISSGWKEAQVQANLRHLSLAAQMRYYTGLKSVKPEMPASNKNKPHETKTSSVPKNEKVKFNNDKHKTNISSLRVH